MISLNLQSDKFNQNKNNNFQTKVENMIINRLKAKTLKTNNHKIKIKNNHFSNESIPDHAKIHVDTESSVILIPIMTRFRIDKISWETKSQSFNIYGMFLINMLVINLFEQLKPFVNQNKITNKKDIINQLTTISVKVNDGPPIILNQMGSTELNIYYADDDMNKKNQNGGQSVSYSRQNIAQDDETFDDIDGYSLFHRQTFKNVNFIPDSMTEYPQLFSDIKIKLEFLEQNIEVCIGKIDKKDKKCPEDKSYHIRFKQFLLDSDISQQVFRRQFSHDVDYVDNYDFFYNFLGQRYKIINFDEIQYQITAVKDPNFDENQSIFPMLISMFAFMTVFKVGSTGIMHFAVQYAYSLYSGIGNISAGQRAQTDETTVTDYLYIASFQLTLAQIIETVLIGIYQQPQMQTFKSRVMLAVKFFVDNQLQYVGAVVQIVILMSAQLQVVYHRLNYHQKKLVQQQDHFDLINQVGKEYKKIELVLDNNHYRFNTQIVLVYILQILGNAIQILRQFFQPFTQLGIISDQTIRSWAFEEQLLQFSKEVRKNERNNVQLSEWRQPTEFEQMKQLDLSIQNLLQIENTYDQTQLDKNQLDINANEQIQNKQDLVSQKKDLTTLDKQKMD